MPIKFNKLCLVALFFVVFVSYGQDTIYYNAKMQKVPPASDSIAYYEVVYPPSDSYNIWEILYEMNGEIVKEKKGVEKNERLWGGYIKKWHSNRNLHYIIQYRESKYDTIRTYWENGAEKRFDSFKNGKLDFGICYDSIGNLIPHFPYDIMPEFPNGIDALYKFIRQNTQYIAKKASIDISSERKKEKK